MKTNKIFTIAAGIALTIGATGCSSDYLDLKPEGVLEYEQVLTNSQGATLAVNGMCNMMYRQYSALYSYNWFNGEPWLSMYYGEVMGQDYISLFWFMGYPELVNWTQMEYYNTSMGAAIAWSYCYEMISQANNLITYTPKMHDENGNVMVNEYGNAIPDFSEDSNPGEYAFRYAQALTFRAHAYSRLMQIYAPRWVDRYQNGEEIGTVPLRLEYVEPEGNLDCPLSPMSVVMDQIYADLYQAIELYESSNKNRTHQWEPNLDVCYGIFARAALLKNDYATAQEMAHNAWQGYTLMTSDEYQMGFAEPNSEWMWTNSGVAQGLYYASFGATYACNGAYPCLWGNIGAGAINNELLKVAQRNDVRATLFYGPRNSLMNEKLFWGNGCNSRTLDVNSPRSSLHDDFVQFAERKYEKVKSKGWYPPYTIQGDGAYVSNELTICTAQFGAQFKFWGTDTYSTSFFPFMRASEMLLIEAESAYQNGDEATALQLLNQLNAQRINNYTDRNYSGAQLLDQIKLCRRMELWGEGFNWFDYKRWDEPIVRVAWRQGQSETGNWPASVARTFGTNDWRWRWRVPSTEYNYNHAIDQAEVTAGATNDDDEAEM